MVRGRGSVEVWFVSMLSVRVVGRGVFGEMGRVVGVESILAWKNLYQTGGESVVGCVRGCCGVVCGLMSVVERGAGFLFVERRKFAS